MEGWRAMTLLSRTRLGPEYELAGLIERALAAEADGAALVSALANRYRILADALLKWREREFGEIERKLERVRSKLQAAGERDASNKGDL